MTLEYYTHKPETLTSEATYSTVDIGSPIKYKFDEGRYLAEITEYINKTYGQHYSREKFQATEFIYDGGHGTGFNIGNVLKYAQRYGKKGTRADARKDLMKVIHYAILQLHVHDEITKKETLDA